MDKISLGSRIYEARKKSHMTSERVAELCECTPTTIRAIESGARLPSVPRLVNICNVLEVTPNDLLGKEMTFPLDKYEGIDSERLKKLILQLQRLPIDKHVLVCSVMECLLKEIEVL